MKMIRLLVLFGVDAIVFSKKFHVKHSPKRPGIKRGWGASVFNSGSFE